MAALTTYTGTADTGQIPADLLDTFIQNWEYVEPTMTGIAWSRPGKGNVPVRFARWNQVTVPAGTKAESDLAPDVEITTSEQTATPGLVKFRMPISDELMEGAIGGIPAGAIVEGLRALVNRVDSDIGSVSTSATQTYGLATDVFTLAHFRGAMAAYKALDVPAAPMGHAAVLGHTSAGQLFESLHSTSATIPTSRGDGILFGPQSGYLFTLHGFGVWESGNVAVEGVGHSNFMTPIGELNSGLGLAVVRAPYVVRTRADEGETRGVDFYHLQAWYGTTLTNPNRLLEVLAG